MSKDYSVYQHYRLLKDIPCCPAGTIFYYDPHDQKRGSISRGCLKLAWLGGGCQNMLCGDAIAFHVKAIEEEDWFYPVHYKYVEALAGLKSALNKEAVEIDQYRVEDQIHLYLIDTNKDVRKWAAQFYRYLGQAK